MRLHQLPHDLKNSRRNPASPLLDIKSLHFLQLKKVLVSQSPQLYSSTTQVYVQILGYLP